MNFRAESCLPCDKRTQEELKITVQGGGWHLNIEDLFEQLLYSNLNGFGRKRHIVVFTNKRSQAKVYTVYFGISSI